MDDFGRFRSSFSLAGWLFAELMIVLAVLFFASAVGVAIPDKPDQGSPTVRSRGEVGMATSAAMTVAAVQTNQVAETQSTTIAVATLQAQAVVTAQAATTAVVSFQHAQATSEASSNQGTRIAAALHATIEVIASVEAAAGLERTQTAAQSTELADLQAQFDQATPTVPPTPTVIQLPTVMPTIVAIGAVPTTFDIDVDLEGVLNGDKSAIDYASEQLHQHLDRFVDQCTAGIALTFGHGTLSESTPLAQAINQLMKMEFPILFGHTAFDAFIDLNPPRGQVDVRIYFLGSCNPS